MTTSRRIAEVFGKEHKDVTRAINTANCSLSFRERNFALSEYLVKNELGLMRGYREYTLTRDGLVFLVMGFTGAKAYP